MRTSPRALLVAAAFAAEAWAQDDSVARRFDLALSSEVTLVGLSAGLRPEVLYRFGDEGTASRLRIAPGILVGPEYLYVPVALGYRAVYRSGRTVRPMVGTGLELQLRMVTDAPVATQLALYVEGGVAAAVTERLTIGLATGLDVTFWGGPSAGLFLRASVGWAL